MTPWRFQGPERGGGVWRHTPLRNHPLCTRCCVDSEGRWWTDKVPASQASSKISIWVRLGSPGGKIWEWDSRTLEKALNDAGCLCTPECAQWRARGVKTLREAGYIFWRIYSSQRLGRKNCNSFKDILNKTNAYVTSSIWQNLYNF